MKILELLNRSKRWCKFQLGIDKNGEGCTGDNPEAVKWCLLGAIQKCYPTEAGAHRARTKIGAAIEVLFPDWEFGIPSWNNAPGTTFRDVRKVLRKANV